MMSPPQSFDFPGSVRTNFVAVSIHAFNCSLSSTPSGSTSTPTQTHDDLGRVLVELGLGDADGFLYVLVKPGRVDDLVAVPGGIGRYDAARSVCLSSGRK